MNNLQLFLMIQFLTALMLNLSTLNEIYYIYNYILLLIQLHIIVSIEISCF